MEDQATNSSLNVPSNHRRGGSHHELEQFLPETDVAKSDSHVDSRYTDFDDDTRIDDGFDIDNESETVHLDNGMPDQYSNDDLLGFNPNKYPQGWLGTVSRFLDGPVPPRDPSVTPIFKSIQYFPAKISQRWPYRLKLCIVATFLAGWAFIFYQLAQHSILEKPTVNGEDIPLLRCGSTYAVWKGKNQACGINGVECGAQHLDDFIFKCPASCREDSYTWSDTAIANYSVIYRPYVVGGNNSYRADSYLCAAALHHGVTNNNKGFIARIVFKGERAGFPGVLEKNNIQSLPFDSVFPQSYEFDDDFTSNNKVSGGRDLRVTIITFNIVMSFIFGYFIQRGDVFYWVFAIVGFWTVVLASNPPAYGSIGDQISAELVSLGFRRFMPYMFGCYVIWMSSQRRQQTDLKECLSRGLFWVTGFWIAVLENYTFSALPVDRLTPEDINKQKGGWITVISIVSFILIAALGQAYIIWRLGKFKKYICIYIGMIMGLVVFGGFKNQTLRIHHYIIGLLLLPGVGFKTTPSLLYAGLLMGLYISGVARWDFDSIIQTAAQLNRGDATNIGGLPELVSPVLEYANAINAARDSVEAISNIYVQWNDLLSSTQESTLDTEHTKYNSDDIAQFSKLWNGYSLIVNDVEQYRGNATKFSLKPWLESSTWANDTLSTSRNIYVRLAFVNEFPGQESTGDYTKAGVIDLNSGEWVEPLDGPS